jgi:hypothetical protein
MKHHEFWAYRGSEGRAPGIFNLGTGWEWPASRLDHIAPAERAVSQWAGGRVNDRPVWICAEEIIFILFWESNPDIPVVESVG